MIYNDNTLTHTHTHTHHLTNTNYVTHTSYLSRANYSSGRTMAGLFWGMASDHYGRRKCLLFAMFNIALFGLLLGFSTSFTMAVLLRLAIGLGKKENTVFFMFFCFVFVLCLCCVVFCSYLFLCLFFFSSCFVYRNLLKRKILISASC